MKKQYNHPELVKINVLTEDIMSLSKNLTIDSDMLDANGDFTSRDAFSWNW